MFRYKKVQKGQKFAMFYSVLYLNTCFAYENFQPAFGCEPENTFSNHFSFFFFLIYIFYDKNQKENTLTSIGNAQHSNTRLKYTTATQSVNIVSKKPIPFSQSWLRIEHRSHVRMMFFLLGVIPKCMYVCILLRSRK